MKHRTFSPAQGVSSIELFYDVMFVYCLGVLTTTMHHVEGGSFSVGQWLSFTFSYMIILQTWVFTIFLMNRFGNRSIGDSLCLLVNMFLLYFIANSIQTGWENVPVSFAVPWAAMTANLIVHCLTKRLAKSGPDAQDKHILNATIIVLSIQLAFAVAAALLPNEASIVASWAGCVAGAGMFSQLRALRSKPASFEHLAERCRLITIIAFGEMVAVIAVYVTIQGGSEWWITMLVFALAVGMFFIYIYEHDNMIDHHAKSDGMAFLLISAWVIYVIGNVSVALEYMTLEEVVPWSKEAYLTGGIVLYLITSFLLGRFHKKEFTYSIPYIIGRIIACIFVIVPAAMDLGPILVLVCDTVVIYLTFWHEWLLYHGRTKLLEFAETSEDPDAARAALESGKGRSKIIRAYRASLKGDDEEPEG